MNLTVTGGADFAAKLAADAAALKRAAAATVEQAAEGLKNDLRAHVVGAGLGQRLANTWRVAYRTGQHQALVYTKAPQIMKGHDQGGVISSSNGFWLVLPGPHCPKQSGRGLRPTPEQIKRMYGRPLVFVSRHPPPSLLVMNLRHGTTAVMFLLFPLVRLPKRLDIEGIVQRRYSAFPGLLTENWDQLQKVDLILKEG